MNTSGDGRTGNLPGPAVAAFRDVTASAVEAARRWRDPAARLRRKTRRARRRATFLGTASGTWGVGTATLVAASAPEWTVVATGGATAVFAVPAVMAYRRFRRLSAVSLPPAPPKRRSRPAVGSVARAPMERLAASEDSLSRLLGVLVRSNSVVPDDLAEIDEAARAASSALEAVAEDVVALESAARGSAAAKAHLASAITAAGQRLDAGVDQFEELVAAAARLAATAEGNRSLTVLEQQRAELIATSDKLESWAQSWREVAQIQQRYRN
ncbi:hypothetical protein OED52_08805 [Rhodococcus sp. Z13]|uniref:Uncharacterized protein n=1 Tax=Rhodococcus sacchari TaxID=2962047 RepID=A0ACD4DKW1_9NOCA|nr:hypothetical protein [Rhodococcus sp. Z13]UYP20598.1 hypothetical protein OED52_08805 [Rhodococcus sp. Z13]